MDTKDKILAIDDNDVNLVMLKAMLSAEYDVVTLSDGSDAENQAAAIKPDLILLDILMPGKDGLSLCSDLKKNPDTQDIPVIIVSARNNTADIATGLRAGADDYLCKPYSTDELRLRIRRRIDASRPSDKILETIRRLTAERDEALGKVAALQTISDNVRDSIILCRPDGSIEAATRSTGAILGLPSGTEIIGRDIAEIPLSDQERESILQLVSASNGAPLRYISQRKRDADPAILETTATQTGDPGNEYIAISTRTVEPGSNEDATTCKELELKLLKLEKEIAGIFKYSAKGILTTSLDLEIHRYNRRFLELFGIRRNINCTGVSLEKILSPKQVEVIKDLVSKVDKPPIFETTQITLQNTDGTKTYIEITASMLKTFGDASLMLIFSDVTQFRNMDNEIMNAAQAAEERERTLLAQELHDGLGAVLSSINIYINLILSGGAEIDEIFKTLRLTKELVGQAIETVKDIANNLHPVILTRFGLVATVSNIIEVHQSSHLIKFHFEHSTFEELKDKDRELSIYRIINELINNTMKYAEARNVQLTLSTTRPTLHIHYADDGKGFDLDKYLASPDSLTMGISNIMGRAKALDGTCEYKTAPGEGVQVDIELPIEARNS
ncbi:MAG: response regulator [Bacteroidales bacterium]|nr:response regulator [Bacteroidales bacterium]